VAPSDDTLEARAQRLRLLLFDVDGVLTDGSIRVHGDGSDAKTFFVRDGSALVWAQREGLLVGLLSGRPSEATTRRAAELGIGIVMQGELDKQAAYGQIVAAHGLSDDEVAFMGDDLPDLPVLERVGLSAAPADAADEVRARVAWVSRYAGGRGAVRELVEVVLRARGRWDAVVRSHLA
jgi:3-deoxy-D-manno-octulosonate 8-phosphate phosphatase (KDO 8-P phosphatase)